MQDAVFVSLLPASDVFPRPVTFISNVGQGPRGREWAEMHTGFLISVVSGGSTLNRPNAGSSLSAGSPPSSLMRSSRSESETEKAEGFEMGLGCQCGICANSPEGAG
eukprot:7213683-Pyramimonas_sp.AAC.1